MRFTIYTLKLENNKYYVGKTKQSIPENRILEHFSYKGGSKWTKKHRPISIISKIEGDAIDEESETLKTMAQFGIDNVRGGSYCLENLHTNITHYEKAKQQIYSIQDKCYTCGEKGHFKYECSKRNLKRKRDDADAFIEKIVKLEEEKYEIQQKYNKLINEVRKNYKI